MEIDLPDYAYELIDSKRYKVLYGGRGSAKSYTIARLLLLKGARRVCRILCGREFQNSIGDSVHFLLSQEIATLGLQNFYSVTQNSIVGRNGTEFIFRGVRNNVASIKSIAGLTDLWLEEAHTISQPSWDVLIPTIREEDSEIWVSFNPDADDDPTYTMFIKPDGEPLERDDAVTLKVNYSDNPWFPEVLRKEKDYLFKVNPDLADHVWNGNVRRNSESQIFRNKYVVREFEREAHFDGPYFGADWGFSTDPSVLVKVYLDLANREILVRHAKFGYGVEIDKLPAMFDEVPESRHFLIRADGARPETISYISRQRFVIEAAEKWKGNVEDGIEWLKGFDRIVIHPECEEMIKEAKKYSYKVDRLTQDVLTDVVDAFNHGWDAIRYALDPLIRSGNISILDVL